jgi:hypothetical protein
MKALPNELAAQFDSLLRAIQIPADKHGNYKKWLRYYLDFCQKYGFQPRMVESLPIFLNKLKEKAQTPEHQNQASHAVTLFYKLLQARRQKPTGQDSSGQQRESSALKPKPVVESKDELTTAQEEWRINYRQLADQIKVRHYSKKTLESYAGWIRKFQSYSHSKEPRLLSGDDIRGYLTFLAVKCRVAASTQNSPREIKYL